MFALSKKIISLFLCFCLVSNPLLAGVVNEACSTSGESTYLFIGDERGNSVATKKEINRDCNLTIESQGACNQWEEKVTSYSIEPSDYNSYRSSNYEDSLGSIFAIMGAYDQLEHLWSGWHGYCEIGTKTNFDWASDPMFWASLMASTFMQASSAPTENIISNGETIGQVADLDSAGFLYKTEIGQSYNNFLGNTTEGFQNLAKGLGMSVGQNFGKCLVASGVDMVANLFSFFTSDSENSDCDPVDEFCEDSENSTTQNNQIMTIDAQAYEDLLAKNPEMADYIEILDEQEGVLTIKFKVVSDLPEYQTVDQAGLQALKDKLKNMQLIISTGLIAAKMAVCLGSSGKWGSSADTKFSSSSAGLFSVKNGIGMAINSIPVQWLGPYGALIKAALAIALELLYSFKKIDTCHDEEDASEAGTRHKKTQETLPFGFCKQTAEKCVEKKFLGSGCGLKGYDYCCYDQLLTKILVVQFKAQLGRDWKHCTGITLRDLNYISFRQCTDHDKTFGFDGANVVLIYNTEGKLTNATDPTGSYQYQRKCIDLTEFKENLSATFNQDIDLSDFDSIFEDLSNQI